MGKYDDLKKVIDELVSTGEKLYKSLGRMDNGDFKDFRYFLFNYEIWYTKALSVVNQISPSRVQDFVLLYKDEKRKELSTDTYTVSDALRGSTRRDRYSPLNAQVCVFRQNEMLRACLELLESKIYDMQLILQADIFDSELEAAKHLLKMGFDRAAGAICGVVLEKHFSKVCENRKITLRKKSPTIADYNDALKDVAYDTVEWRRIQRLADIRNLCDHSQSREPEKDEVDELVKGTEKIINTIF